MRRERFRWRFLRRRQTHCATDECRVRAASRAVSATTDAPVSTTKSMRRPLTRPSTSKWPWALRAITTDRERASAAAADAAGDVCGAAGAGAAPIFERYRGARTPTVSARAAMTIMERIGGGACSQTSHHAAANTPLGKCRGHLTLTFMPSSRLTRSLAFSASPDDAKALQIPCCREFSREFSELPFITATRFPN